jgi:hypothetical protein
MRTEREIEKEVDKIDPEAAASGASKWPGMSFEQGVDAALRWVLGWSDEPPMEDD